MQVVNVKKTGRNFLRRLGFGSSLLRSTAKLASGAALAQVILVGVSPIITRIYTPADLGTLAAFMALVSPLALVAAGGYSQALVLPKRLGQATDLALFALGLCVVIGLLTLAAVVLTALRYPTLYWLLWLPLAVALAGANSVLIGLANRQGLYGLMASNSVVRAAAQGTGQVAAGLLWPSAGALVAVTTVTSAVANVRLTGFFVKLLRQHPASWQRAFVTAKAYRDFPKHTLPAALLGQVQFAGLPLLVGALFGATTLGLWSLAQRLLSMPLSVLGGAIADVYYRRAVELVGDTEASMRLLRLVLTRLLVVSLPIFIPIGILAPWLFGFVFGPSWEIAGEYARIMLPLLWVRFVTTPVSRTTLVFRRNKIGLVIQGVRAALLAAVGLAAWGLGLDFTIFLTLLTALWAAVYVASVFVYVRVIRKGVRRLR